MRVPNIQIKNVPTEVHARLAERARAHGQSLQQYLLGELQRLAATPTNAEIFEEIRARGQLVPLEPGLVARTIRDAREEQGRSRS